MPESESGLPTNKVVLAAYLRNTQQPSDHINEALQIIEEPLGASKEMNQVSNFGVLRLTLSKEHLERFSRFSA